MTSETLRSISARVWLLLFSRVKQTTVSSQSVTALEAFEADYNQENECEEENVEQFFEDCESRPLRTRTRTHNLQCAFLISVPLNFFCEIVMCSIFVSLDIMWNLSIPKDQILVFEYMNLPPSHTHTQCIDLMQLIQISISEYLLMLISKQHYQYNPPLCD